MTARELRATAAALLILAGIFGLGVALGLGTEFPRLPDWLTRSDRAQAGTAMAPSQPVRIAVPDAGIDGRVHPVGLDRSGAIASPHRPRQAGWYEDGPTPGQFGAAVIVGHVDDTSGPEIFHGLAAVSPGTRIEVTRRDGNVAAFEVTAVRSYDKQSLPPDEVYGDFRHPELRLITCGGAWVGGDQGYAENVVVFATLVS